MAHAESGGGAGWNVAYGGGPAGPYAYRRHQVIVRGEGAVDAVRSAVGDDDHEWPAPTSDGDGSWLVELPHSVDVPGLVADLKNDGIVAEPNYVLFAHACCCAAHPAWRCGWAAVAGGVYLDPVHANFAANPVHANMAANPVHANDAGTVGVYASPLYADPVHANVYISSGLRKSSARPAPPRDPRPAHPGGGARVVILDTGLADSAHLPPLLGFLDAVTPNPDRDGPDENGDGELDPAAGHGTFVAGLIELLEAGTGPILCRVLNTTGDGDAWAIGSRLLSLATSGVADAALDDRTIFNMSFGGYAPEEMWYLARQIRRVQRLGAVVVASAGNDATCQPSYPACLPGVVGVGALGPYGPALFTNYGPWVRACAPGVDLVSAFFGNFNGPLPAVGTVDPDRFEGWACWSGTSFSTPTVVAALAREMARSGCSAPEAVTALIDDPLLLRIDDLGTVINVV